MVFNRGKFELLSFGNSNRSSEYIKFQGTPVDPKENEKNPWIIFQGNILFDKSVSTLVEDNHMVVRIFQTFQNCSNSTMLTLLKTIVVPQEKHMYFWKWQFWKMIASLNLWQHITNKHCNNCLPWMAKV